MSIIWENEEGCILCHSLYLHSIFNNIDCENLCHQCNKYTVFHIDSPFRKFGQKIAPTYNYSAEDDLKYDISKLGSYTSSTFKTDEIAILEKVFIKLMQSSLFQEVKYFSKKCEKSHQNQESMKAAAEILNTETKFIEFNGGNTDHSSISVTLENQNYLIPPNCRFFNCNVHKISSKLDDLNLYDFILIDPPWRNKHVRRKNATAFNQGYALIHTEEITEIPVPQLLSPQGLVGVWCTNSEQQVTSLVTKIFPTWGIEYVATWYWIKVRIEKPDRETSLNDFVQVTQDGQPICDFSFKKDRKQPYERLIFGCPKNRHISKKNPDANKVIISIPSNIHSHKPPLTGVLSKFLPSGSRCIELFARYLLPNWTSCGNEVLKLQHQLLFK